MIQVIRTGRSPTMKHLHRVHRVCVVTLHERLVGNDPTGPIQLVYTPSDSMRADVYTKHMTNKDRLEPGLRMSGVFPAGHMGKYAGDLHAPNKGKIRLRMRSAFCLRVAIPSRLTRRA